MSEAISKQKKAFFRKLYLAYLIAEEPKSLAQLHEITQMPRRTLQDTLKDMGDVGIQCRFIQQEGGRNNQGHFTLEDWGPVNADWLSEHIDEVSAPFAL